MVDHKPRYLGLNRSDFESLIKKDCIYIDKTKIIYELITKPGIQQFYFISRPRRFGKSLFISTLKSIFSGDKELFTQYWIGKETDYDWPKHPIIHLDFGGIGHLSPEQLEQSLYNHIHALAHTYGITLPYSIIADSFIFLVQELSKQNKVVLLIDEYDKPLVDHIDNLVIAEKNRKILNNFYTAVKSLEAHWRAIFITGVSKFTKTSLFSGLNNIKELTFDSRTAELFGYTYHDLITYLDEPINNFAQKLDLTTEQTLEKMRLWYDGYRFCDDMQKAQMYNPLSIIACLDDKRFSNYWFDTGTPGFLIPLLRTKSEALEIPETIQVPVSSFNAFDIKDISLYALLVQTGYLTIVNYDPETQFFTLDYPNREVRESFKNYLLQAFAYTTSGDIANKCAQMVAAINSKDFEKFFDTVKAFFANMPYNLHIKQEAHYHALFHLLFDVLGMQPKSEDASSQGRADLVLETSDSIIIFEFKLNSTVQKALDQILERKYYEKYLNKNKTIILLGVNFTFKNKKLAFAWREQQY